MHNLRCSRRAVLYPLAIAFLLAGCSSGTNKVGSFLGLDTDIKLSFDVGPDVNPDDNGKPAPVFVRLYELKSTTMFDKAGFIELYERDEELLGADFAGKHVLKPFRPGENRVERMVLGKDTRYVGLYVEFLRYKGSHYKAVVPVVGHNIVASSARIQLSGNQITIVGGK
jgi:type VI secretion system protein VasD